MPIVPITSGLVQPSLDAILNQYKNDPNPIDDKIIDKISILCLLSSVTLFKKSAAIVIVIITSGSTVINNARHVKCASKKPDSVGPIAGPKAITIPIIPIAVPRRSTGIIAKRTVINRGSMIPDPDACTIRPKSRTEKTGARAEIIVPSPNILMAVKNSVLVVKRSIKNADIGIIIPLRSEEHTSELQSRGQLVCRLLLERTIVKR